MSQLAFLKRQAFCLCLLIALILLWSFSVQAAALKTTAKPMSVGALVKRVKQQSATRYFGLYFQGQKVGWMSLRFDSSQPGSVSVINEVDFTLTVGGAKTRMKSLDTRIYSSKTGQLTALRYSMSGPTGDVRLSGVAQGKRLQLFQSTGGRESQQQLTFAGESLQDVLAIESAIWQGKALPGYATKSRSFDASVQKSLTTDLIVKQRETRLIAGVQTELIRVDGRIAELGLSVVSWYDDHGEMLETLVAGFLTARWETEKQAKSGISQADFMRATLIESPQALSDLDSAAGVKLELSGVPESLRIESERQHWQNLTPKRQQLTVTVEKLDLAKTPAPNTFDRKQFDLTLQATHRIQTDDPAIQKQAAKLAEGVKTSGELARRIMRWVYDNVEKRYTPTFSNASETMSSLVGDCGEHAVLFVALCRAANLPAQEVMGLVYSESQGGFGYHAWAQVWLGRWVSIDPSWGQFPVDAGHLAFTQGGMEAQVQLTGLMGSVQVEKAERLP